MPFRKLIPDYHRAMIVAGALLIIITTFIMGMSIAGSYLLTVSYVHRVNALATAQYDACLSTNEARSAQIVLWDHVLDVSAQDPRNQTPQARKTRAAFRVFIHNQFAPRRCVLHR